MSCVFQRALYTIGMSNAVRCLFCYRADIIDCNIIANSVNDLGNVHLDK